MYRATELPNLLLPPSSGGAADKLCRLQHAGSLVADAAVVAAAAVVAYKQIANCCCKFVYCNESAAASVMDASFVAY